MFTVAVPLGGEPGAQSGAQLEAQSGVQSVAIMQALQSAPYAANELVEKIRVKPQILILIFATGSNQGRLRISEQGSHPFRSMVATYSGLW